MKRYTFLITLLPGIVCGQNTDCDTTRVENLDEIIVTAATHRTDATTTVYIPEARQREAAADGVSLLGNMNIPQLNVDRLSGKVSTIDNQPVSFFINGRQAGAEDLSGLNPVDVKRVEYLDFPSDPRYLRAAHVVNFVTRRYTYGGYTKVGGKERFMVHSGEASVYSKFAYRAMEYDATVNGSFDNNSHTGTCAKETYRFPKGNIERKTEAENSRNRQRNFSAALRASWTRSQSLVVRNLLSFTRDNIPFNEITGKVTFSDIFQNGLFKRMDSKKAHSLNWICDIYAGMQSGWALNSSIELTHTFTNNSENYISSAVSIDNFAHEKALSGRINTQISKALSNQFSIIANLIVSRSNTDIVYRGTDCADNSFSQWFGGLYAGLSANWRKVAGSIDGGFALESNSINNHRTDDRYPFTHLNVQYSPNSRNRIGLWFQYATISPNAAIKNPNTIRQSELMSVGGNPELESSRLISSNLNYTFLPDNRWQLTAYAALFRIARRQAPVYTPDGPDGTMLKHYMNDGNYNHGQVGARVSAKFFEGRLTVSVAPRLLLYRCTGTNSATLCSPGSTMNVDYYLGHFFFNVYAGTPDSYVDGETCFRRRLPGQYSVGMGWSRKGWNIQLSAANIFRSSWKTSSDTLLSPHYDSRITNFGSDRHRRINLSIQYTLSYGKKMAQSAELTTEKAISSSILR